MFRSAPLRIVAICALVLAGCGKGADKDAAKAAAPPQVTVVAVSRDGAAGTVRASGLVAYQRETALSFKVPGVIARLNVDEGDRVSAGQSLASLNLTEYSANFAEADAALRTAESQLARAQTLHEKGLVAQARLDDAQLSVDRARAARQSTGFNRSQGVIIAPSSGVILRRSADPNQNVSPGQPVLTLGEVNSGLIVRAGIAASDAARIKTGDAATIRITGLPGETRTGRVTRVSAKSDAATGGFDVEIAVTPIDGLRSGLVAEADIAASGGDGEAGPIRAPTLALLDARADQGVVLVVDAQNIAHRRAVQTAGLDRDSVLIVGGLEPGERVVSSGAAYVRDGQSVSVSVSESPAIPAPATKAAP
ncbi:MAG: RND family efflux transporter MFP subunit [Alphaproteobacteria bacterium]|nr:MAG: RND family efflux transporter MFP subunit [Caulobacteraceae bacterium]TPW05461.1 MAG: RND family efflux transporter MFP subunit [Alphaproteobacteria bacterium]